MAKVKVTDRGTMAGWDDARVELKADGTYRVKGAGYLGRTAYRTRQRACEIIMRDARFVGFLPTVGER